LDIPSTSFPVVLAREPRRREKYFEI